MPKQYLRIKDLMAEHRVSGKELSERVGVSTTSISAIVTGKAQPRFELLEDIAKVLGVEIGDLFTRSDQHPLYIKQNGQFVEIGTIDKKL